MPLRRVFVVVIDSLGVGALPDASRFGDEGAHTLDHIMQATGGLDLPNLVRAGLGHISGVSHVPRTGRPEGSFGRMQEISPGKDTPTGHWEMMNCPLSEEFPVFPGGFPEDLMAAWLTRTGLKGFLENASASGTEVIERCGVEHMETGFPIVYTSADSVFQVAVHAPTFGIERLYSICEAARELLDPIGLGRVIARPFKGEPGSFERTYDRRDYAIPPPQDTTLDRLKAAGHEVCGVGKIGDIFSGRGLTQDHHTEGNEDGMAKTLELAGSLDSGMVFTNLVDFDSLYGHRRDPQGYGRALERFDLDLGRLLLCLRSDDLLFLTADHGTDPTHQPGTDHTREYVPLVALGENVEKGYDLGTLPSFCALGATIEEALGLDAMLPGRSFLSQIQAR